MTNFTDPKLLNDVRGFQFNTPPNLASYSILFHIWANLNTLNFVAHIFLQNKSRNSISLGLIREKYRYSFSHNSHCLLGTETYDTCWLGNM